MRIADDESLSISSAGVGWEGISLEQQRLPPTETPEMYMPGHTFSVQIRPPELFEARMDGRPKETVRMAPGDVHFLSAGAPGRYAWREGPDPGARPRVRRGLRL